MKFVEFKKSLSIVISPCYVLHGIDRYLIDNCIRNLLDVTAGVFSDFNRAFFSGKDEIEDILSSAFVLPLGNEKRVIVVKDYNFNEKTLKKLENYLKNDNSLSTIVFTTSEPVNLEGVVNVDCGKLSYEVISKKVLLELKKKEYQISNDALETLVSFCDYDMGRVMVEIDKLISVASETKFIVRQMVETNTSKDENFNIYELTDCLGKKDLDKALIIVNSLLEDNGSKGLIAAIYQHFRRLLYVAVSSNLTSEGIASRLGVKPYAIDVVRPQVKLFGAKKLRAICDELRKIDEDSKTTFASVENLIYYIIFKIGNM